MLEIVVLDGTDVPSPEDTAMLQALYSRSPESVHAHLKKVREVGSGKFLQQYLINYGHKSIGDCGSTSIFIENVSMLVAKAVQDWPLYSGQEASTRYLDMAAQDFLNPLETVAGGEIQIAWREFYSYLLRELVPSLKERFPRQEGQDEKIYEKAIKARAFDIARGFLPAGATTLVSWHTNLRQASDHLKGMRHHPLQEVRAVASSVLDALKAKYTSSFLHKQYADEEVYLAASEREFAYYQAAKGLGPFLYENNLRLDALATHRHLLSNRPPRAELHHRFKRYGTIEFYFPLDFGSYRDLQRQRSCVQEMPLLTTDHGFHTWYLEQMPENLRMQAKALLVQQKNRIAALDCEPEVRQYYIAMGYVVPVEMFCSLPSAVYIAELRSSDAVHPTLRVQAQRMGDALAESVPGLKMHHDRSPGTWNIKRGEHDIVKV